MMTNRIGGLNAMNAAFNWMGAANSLMSFQGNSRALELQMLNDSFNYKAYSAMDDMQQRIINNNIKRSFSVFA